MQRGLLDTVQIEELKVMLPSWQVSKSELSRTFQFSTFIEAFGFMTKCALIAERMDHHPNWTNVYGEVKVCLTTHDKGGVTELDQVMAQKLDVLADGSH